MQHTIYITNHGFEPSGLSVAVEDAALFQNEDTKSHSVVSGSISEPVDSGEIEAGTAWTHEFEMPGTYDFHCTIHPDEHMIIKVIETTDTFDPPENGGNRKTNKKDLG